MVNVDFHVHSQESDGSDACELLPTIGKGLAVMALTDHDTTSGCAAFLKAAEERRARGLEAPRCIAGVEISADTPEFKKFHMLGLNVDPEAEGLSSLLAKVRDSRDERNVKIVDILQHQGIDICLDEVKAQAGCAVVGKPHFAQVLIGKGVVVDIKDAFRRFLGPGTPVAEADRFGPLPADAIRLIHEAGGIAVWAHPAQSAKNLELLRAALGPLREQGLDGIEAYYSSNDIELTRAHLALAREFGFLVTAGSDYHGRNKANPVRPGIALPEEDFARLMERF